MKDGFKSLWTRIIRPLRHVPDFEIGKWDGPLRSLLLGSFLTAMWNPAARPALFAVLVVVALVGWEKKCRG